MNLLFLYKILHNLIDCCSLLSQINFCVGKHSITTRSKNLFYGVIKKDGLSWLQWVVF
jgi:hypothetical protein